MSYDLVFWKQKLLRVRPLVRITYTIVFCATLVVVWSGVGWFADFDTYMEFPNGNLALFEKARASERIICSLVIGLVVATLSTSVMWARNRLRRSRSSAHGNQAPTDNAA
jgi:hypothetical protein